MSERPIGDHVDPLRAGSATWVVNAVTRAVGVDAAGWRWDRLVNMAAQLENEAGG